MTTTPPGPGSAGRPDRARLYAPFRPRMARLVSLVLAVVLTLGTVALVASLWDYFGVVNGLGVLAVGLAMAWFCWREASVRADVDEQGVTVRNLVVTRRLEWAEVVAVRFGQGRPWVQLDLSDGDVLAVMGVQQSDGERAVAESRRLAALVAIHSRTARDD
jgi:hypothetical protein